MHDDSDHIAAADGPTEVEAEEDADTPLPASSDLTAPPLPPAANRVEFDDERLGDEIGDPAGNIPAIDDVVPPHQRPQWSEGMTTDPPPKAYVPPVGKPIDLRSTPEPGPRAAVDIDDDTVPPVASDHEITEDVITGDVATEDVVSEDVLTLTDASEDPITNGGVPAPVAGRRVLETTTTAIRQAPLARALPDATADHPMEMRQVAGLTSGSVMPLDLGAFQFSESIQGSTFSIRVATADEVLVVPGTADAVVDDSPVSEPTPLGRDGILNVGSACFSVRPPRRPLSPLIRAQSIESMLRAPTPTMVPAFEPGEPVGQPSDLDGMDDAPALKRPDGSPLMLTMDQWVFLGRVRRARSAMAERHRQLHPNPEELKSRLSRLEPGLWDRNAEHQLFGRFAVAYSSIPWEPRFDNPERIPEALHQPIFAMAVLPWVPVTANLKQGPLGIVGPRSAALAVARHSMISLAALTAAGELEFSIVTAKTQVDAWSWSAALPRSLFPSDSNIFTVVVADGMEFFESAGLDHERVKANELGLIAVAETADELPPYCGTIVHLQDDGTCEVANHLGERIPGTPIGVTEAFAQDIASQITDIVEPRN